MQVNGLRRAYARGNGPLFCGLADKGRTDTAKGSKQGDSGQQRVSRQRGLPAMTFLPDTWFQVRTAAIFRVAVCRSASQCAGAFPKGGWTRLFRSVASPVSGQGTESAVCRFFPVCSGKAYGPDRLPAFAQGVVTVFCMLPSSAVSMREAGGNHAELHRKKVGDVRGGRVTDAAADTAALLFLIPYFSFPFESHGV